MNEPIVSGDKQVEFENLARPLIKFLNDKFDPHTKIIIESGHAEIVSGLCAFRTDDYILD